MESKEYIKADSEKHIIYKRITFTQRDIIFYILFTSGSLKISCWMLDVVFSGRYNDKALLYTVVILFTLK